MLPRTRRLMLASAIHPTGLHRLDGGLPSGNSKNTNGIDVIARSGIQPPSQATTVAPGSDPGEVKRAYTT